MKVAARRRRKPQKPLAPEWDVSEEAPPTPETVAKLKTDAVRKLVGKALTEPQWEAAREIREIREAIGRGLFPCRTLGKEMDVSGPLNAPFRDPMDRLSRREAAIWSENYRPWSDEMKAVARVGWRGPVTFMHVIEVVVIDNVAVSAADRLLGFPERNAVALGILRTALQRYAEIAGWVSRIE